MARKSAAFLVALACSLMPVRASEVQAAHWTHDNPFCGVLAAVAPLRDGLRYGLRLFSQQGVTLAAHVTLVSDTDAYDALVSESNLFGPRNDRELNPIVVTLPSKDLLKFFFVDSYSVDGGTKVTCPSYVFAIGSQVVGLDDDAEVISAQHVQSLGRLPCGQMYFPPQIGHQFEGIIGSYGDKRLTTSYRIFIDSAGQPIREELIASSGVVGVDTGALGTIQGHQFVPAKFLCTPVVGVIDIEMEYDP
ncbi:MAG: hypothetical protein JOZ77_11015 [Candidatus Eremiobacteraeota bacterium]|nr:hypothetical protein [Candidatus Eremiobacteraeota bacterium]